MRPILVARALRAVVDGYVAVLLSAYLLASGFADWQVGVLSTATLHGSAAATLALGAWGQRFVSRSLLLAAALLMSATGLLLAGGGALCAELGPSRPVVLRLAALFSVDAFGVGLVVNSLLALWLFRRFELTLTDDGQFFFWAGLLSALSQLAAPHVARHIGLLNTMVFTHIPANLALIAAAFAPSLELALGLLFLRAALSQMDAPTRSA